MNNTTDTLAKYCIDKISHRQRFSTDHVHDTILKSLIASTQYFREQAAIPTIYSPLGIIKGQESLNRLIHLHFQKYQGYNTSRSTFIRDCLHIRGPVHLNGIHISDRFPHSGMGREFSHMVNQINHKINAWINVRGLFRATRFKQWIKQVPPISRLAHRDAIQIIPPNMALGTIGRYEGAWIDKVRITNCKITSSTSLQGIFSSDGMIRSIYINNAMISVKGEHAVTLAGVMSGRFHNVIDGYNNTVKVKLLPLRLGGGKLNINILNFKRGGNFQYDAVEGRNVEDLRFTPRPRGRNIIEFDMDYFYKQFPKYKQRYGNQFTAIDRLVTDMLNTKRCVNIESLIDKMLKG